MSNLEDLYDNTVKRLSEEGYAVETVRGETICCKKGGNGYWRDVRIDCPKCGKKSLITTKIKDVSVFVCIYYECGFVENR